MSNFGLIAYTKEGRTAFKFDTHFTAFRQKISVVLNAKQAQSISIPGINQNWFVSVSPTAGHDASHWIESYITDGVLHLLAQNWGSTGTAYIDVLVFETLVLT
jgi:hypothetical protein